MSVHITDLPKRDVPLDFGISGAPYKRSCDRCLTHYYKEHLFKPQRHPLFKALCLDCALVAKVSFTELVKKQIAAALEKRTMELASK